MHFFEQHFNLKHSNLYGKNDGPNLVPQKPVAAGSIVSRPTGVVKKGQVKKVQASGSQRPVNKASPLL